MSPKRIAIISLVVASILWASSGTVAKILLPKIDMMPLFMIRVGLGSLILLPFYLTRKPTPFMTTLKDLWPAVLGSFGNFFFFILGISRTTANAAAIIYTITPLLTLILARKKIQESNSPRKLFGIILGFTGVLTIALLPIISKNQEINGDPLGNFFILCAVLSWTFYIVSSREIIDRKHYPPLAVTTYSVTISFLLFVVITLFTPHRALGNVVFMGSTPWLLLYYGAGLTAVTFLLHQWAIKHSSATTASLTNYLQPIFAFVYNAVFIGEKLSFIFIVGSLLVFAGTFIATSEQASAYMKTSKARRQNG